jgi:signal transduction histidine kinase
MKLSSALSVWQRLNSTATSPSLPARFRSSLRELLASVWPAALPNDSESIRRKKMGVRLAHLGIASMILFAVAGRLAALKPTPLGALQACGLLAASLLYIIWYLTGFSDTVQGMLWEHTSGPEPARSHLRKVSHKTYFAVLYLAAACVCLLEGPHGGSLLAWLVLLSPVVLGVFRLRWHGVVVVAMTSLAAVGAVCWWHEWMSLSKGLLQFSCALLFAILLPALVVMSEKSRRQLEHLANELSDANQQLREYAVQTEELVATRERNRIAREIHDSLGHYLTGVYMQLEAARALSHNPPSRLNETLEKAQALTQLGLQDIRRSVATLRAMPLQNQTLEEALRQLADQNRCNQLAIEIRTEGTPRVLPTQTTLTLYRTGQEGLTNIRKHAQASHASVVLDYRRARTVLLKISDNGAGAAGVPPDSSGFGLLGLRERAILLGGTLRLHTSPGTGFTLEVEVPG